MKHEVDKVMRHVAGGNHVPRQLLPFILSEKAIWNWCLRCETNQQELTKIHQYLPLSFLFEPLALVWLLQSAGRLHDGGRAPTEKAHVLGGASLNLSPLVDGLLKITLRLDKCIATSNRCLTSSNKKLLETSALLVVTSALLVVTIRM